MHHDKPCDYKTTSILRFLNTAGSDLFEKTDRWHEYTQTAFADGVWAYRVCRLEKNGSRALVETEFGVKKWVLDCAGNDYLNLGVDPEVIAATKSAIDEYGVNARGASMLNGNSPLHLALERALADFLGKEAVLLSPSGYASMVAAVQGLLRPTDAVFYDKLCHSSLVEGMKLSGATMYLYPHRCMESLRKMLEDHRSKHRGAMIVTDGVFSAHGTVAPVDSLIELARQFDAKLLVDDAHGIGTLNNGHGCAALPGVDIVTGTLSKAFGACGGFVAGPKKVINYLRMFGNATCATTNISIPNTAAALQALTIVRREPDRVKQLQHKVRHLRQELRQIGIETINSDSPIVSLICGRDLNAWLAWRDMFNDGILLHALPFPIVPHGEACLRLRLNSGMDDADLDALVRAIKDNAEWFRPKKLATVSAPALPAKDDFTRTTVATDLGEVVVHQKGRGKPVVFLHSLLFGSEIYEKVFQLLPDDLAVYAIDWWGHGCSAPITTPVTLEQMTDCLQQIMKQLIPAGQAVTIVGTSMGGMIALRLAVSNSHLVNQLILIGTSADEEDGPSKRLFTSMAAQARSLSGRTIVKDLLSLNLSAKYLDSQSSTISRLEDKMCQKSVTFFMPCIAAVLDRCSVRDKLPMIAVKTTIIVGDEDIAESPAHSGVMADLIPHAKLIIVPNCGHLVSVEQPQVIAEALYTHPDNDCSSPQ